MQPKLNLVKRYSSVICLALLSLPAIWQIITPGYFPIHDNTQTARIFEMYQTLKNHGFPARWANDLGFGYGYPIFNFYNPLPYYFGAFFMFLGTDALLATKIMFIIPIILSTFSAYILTRLILNKWGSLMAGILYLYAPYHGVQIFVRGAVAEYWAYAILPLLFWAIWKKKFFTSIFSLAALILSHNLTAFMSIPFVSLLVLIKFFNTKNKLPFTVYCLLFIVLALSFSAFFWIPAIFQSKLTLVNQMVFQEFDPPALHVIQPFQLWSGSWGYGGSSIGTDDGLSLQLGKIHLVGSLSGILILSFVIARSWRRGNLDRHATSWLAMTGLGLLFSLFMLLPSSSAIWKSIPTLNYIQFPWRFLTFASLFSSLLSALAINKTFNIIPATVLSEAKGKAIIYKNNLNRLRISLQDSGMTIVYILFIVYSVKFFQPQFKYPTTAKELTSKERLIWEVSMRSYEYLPRGFVVPPNIETAMRVDNSQNILLVEKFKKDTNTLQDFSNIISLITFITLVGYFFYVQTRNYRRIAS